MTTLKEHANALKEYNKAWNALDSITVVNHSFPPEVIRLKEELRLLAEECADFIQSTIIDKWLEENNFPWQEEYEEYEYYCIKEEEWFDWYDNNIATQDNLVSYIATITNDFGIAEHKELFHYRIPKEWIENNFPNLFEYETVDSRPNELIAHLK